MGACAAGHNYTLVIDADWQDARGQSLACGNRFTSPRSTSLIDIKSWQESSTPAAASQEPLTVTLPEPLDHSLLLLHVTQRL